MQYHPQAVRSPTRLTVSMTPMIDVVFLLLIFFLCTATFQVPEEDLAASLLLQEETPAAAAGALSLPELDDVRIEGRLIDGQAKWFVNQGPTPYDVAALGPLLRSLAEIDRGLPVSIEPAGEIELAEVVNVYDMARLAGFDQVQLVVEARLP